MMQIDSTTLLGGLPPALTQHTQILILGSFPGIASLASAQYYAHPRNQFWPLLSLVLDMPLVAMPYHQRLQSLLDRGIGLWDVIDNCCRVGSLDCAIRDSRANDFLRLLDECPKLHRVCFNGKTSGKFAPAFAAAGYQTLLLPSSSPANAQSSFAQKLEIWRGMITDIPKFSLMLIKRKSIEAQANHKDGPGRKAVFLPPPKPARKVKYAPVTLSEQDGVRFLHFGTEWVQGAMRLRKPDWIELEYAQQMMAWMLFIDRPVHLVQLGLGTGALTKFCYRQFSDARVTAVELNPAVISICRSMFKLPQDDARLQILEIDAQDFVDDAHRHGTIDVLQIDLYDATAKGPVLESAIFYQSCAACLTDDGMITVNLFGDHPSYERNLKAMQFVFDAVICLPEVHDGNVVALGFKRRPTIDFGELYAMAVGVIESTRLPAKSWVNGIKQWIEQ